MSLVNESNSKSINDIIQNGEDNMILNERIEKNEENIINTNPVNKKSSSNILKSPKKESLEFSEKKIFGDINALIKSRFKIPKIEDNSEQQFFLNLLIPANVNLNLNIKVYFFKILIIFF